MEPQITHGENLWEALDVVRDAGQHGAKTCLGMGSFLFERAKIEDGYGKVGRNIAPLPAADAGKPAA